MTDTEKRALKEAFGIPEPQNKRKFIAEHQELSEGSKKRLIPPLFIKIASTSAVCALVCGIWANVSKNSDVKLESSSTGGISVITTDETNEDSASANNTNKEDNAAPAVTAKTTSSTGTGRTASTSAKTTTVTTVKAESGSKTAEEKDEETDQRSEGTASAQESPKATTSKQDKPRTTASSTKQSARTTATTQEPHKDDPVSVDPIVPPAPDVPAEPVPQGTDKTITPGITYRNDYIISKDDLDPNKGKSGGSPSPGNTAEPPDGAITPPSSAAAPVPSQLIYGSDYVVRAVVDDIMYTSEGGTPYTQLDITVREVLRDGCSLVQGDRISVRYIGGYLPAKEYAESHGWDAHPPENSVVYIPSDNRITPGLGLEFIMFLKDGDNNMPDGCFAFTLMTDNSVYTSNGKEIFSLDRQHSFLIDEINR